MSLLVPLPPLRAATATGGATSEEECDLGRVGRRPRHEAGVLANELVCVAKLANEYVTSIATLMRPLIVVGTDSS